MSIRVTIFDENNVTFDNGDAWTKSPDGSLDVHKTDGTIVGSFAQGRWSSVRKVQKEDKALQFEEALELVGLVDKGNFGHQDSDWVERAEALLAANK